MKDELVEDFEWDADVGSGGHVELKEERYREGRKGRRRRSTRFELPSFF